MAIKKSNDASRSEKDPKLQMFDAKKVKQMTSLMET
jgi:hypothetical protein